jgi:hypothetical protein
MRQSASLALLICLSVMFCDQAIAQGTTNVKYGDKHQAYVDSIKKSEYKWTFPAWGKRVTKKGFDLPYSGGIMANTYVGSQQVVISQLQVGINDNPLVPLDFIKFGEIKANLQSITVRPDLWVLPFLDVYAIAGFSYAQTNVSVVSPFSFSTTANFKGSTFGLGTTLSGGYHGFIAIVDLNHIWTTMDKIEGAVETTIFTTRIGFNILFKNNPKKNIAVWVGAPGFFMNRITEGSIDLSDLKSTNGSKTELESAANGSAGWSQSLSPSQKTVVKTIAQKILDKMNGADIKGATIRYSLKKEAVSNWSMCMGAQLQLSHRWQIRTEAGFLGGKQSLLLSGNYRFRW